MAEREQTPTAQEPVLSDEPSLVVVHGPGAGLRARIGSRLTIGRSSRCGLSLPERTVSRTHAEVVATGHGYLVRDLGSANGTHLNGRVVASATLRDGDELRLGDVLVRVELEPPTDDSGAGANVVLRAGSSVERARIRMQGEPTSLRRSLLSADAARADRARLRLDALVAISQRLTRLEELPVLYPMVVDEVMRALPAERAVLFRALPDGSLEPEVTRHRDAPDTPVEVSRTILEEACADRVCVLSADALADEEIATSDSIMLHDIRSVLCVPITYEEDLLGALYLDAPGRQGAFAEEDLHFVSGIAGVAAVSVTNALALERVQAAGHELNHAYLSMLAVLANAIEARDHYTIGHTWRVARFAQATARRLGWSEERISEIEVGGMLHDIGKIGVPDSILTKSTPLSLEEQGQMRLHPQIGARMLRDVPSLEHVLPYVLHHHERFDGGGYPDRLAGDDIPEEARLLAVADALDAMTSNRPYRRGLECSVALGEIRSGAGAQFDPEVVAALDAAFAAGELTPYFQVGLHDAHDVICPHCSTTSTPDRDAVGRRRTVCPTCQRQLELVLEGDQIHAELE